METMTPMDFLDFRDMLRPVLVSKLAIQRTGAKLGIKV